MPTYKAPRHGVSHSEALHEAAFVAPAGRVMLTAYELFHSIGTVEPIYIVNDDEPFTGTKEAGAARDPGAAVEYLASHVEDGRPEESDAAPAPEIALKVGNVSGVMTSALRAARGSLEPWELVVREYASDDPSGPSTLPPMRLLATGVDADGESITLRAGYGDVANVSVPTITFKRSEHPGLVR
jgi:hypothetical protein